MTGLSEYSGRWFLSFGGLWLLVSAACLLPAQVHGSNEGVGTRVEKLLKDGRYGEAEKEIRQAQAADGDSAQLKFSACVLLAQQSAAKKAIACFQQLSQAHPEMPEIYNNIGVLYAGIGVQLEARKWFERGLKQQQAYAVLHQNLLNLQAEINRNAYAAALQLDISKSNAPPKLSLLGKLTSLPEATSPLLSSSGVALPGKATALVAPVVGPEVAKGQLAGKLTQTSPVMSASVQAAESPDKTTDLNDPSQVRETVQAWANAWSKKDLNAYLKAYSPSFNPGVNLSRSAWEAQRRDRIMSKKQIQIELSDFNISFSKVNAKATATATFLQSYQSGTIVTVGRKTLELSEDKGQWLITREMVIGAGS